MRFLSPLHAALVITATCFSDPPTISDYFEREGHEIARLGDFLYIDGGVITQSSDGSGESAVILPVNTTLSIPLRESWTNTSLKMAVVPKSGAPKTRSGALWVDTTKQSIYTWGDPSQTDDATFNDTRLWRLTADSAGGGFWQAEDPVNANDMLSLQRTSAGASGTCYNIGFQLGGTVTNSAKPGDGPLLIPGLTMYNMTSSKWTNDSATAFTPHGTLFSGEAVCLPTFGPSGLILFLGGVTSFGDNWQDAFGAVSHSAGIGFDNLTFYDPLAKRWYSQIATGSRPTPRRLFCAAGVQGPNNTYEVYIFGGNEFGTVNRLGDLYVLSLPGFVWFKASFSTAVTRGFHRCAALGDSQMISVGGWVDPNRDAWSQGIGVFDLPSMSMKSSYDPNSGPYDSPQVVKDWYSKGGQDLVQWSSDTIKSLFITSKVSSPSSTPSPSPSQPANPGALDSDLSPPKRGLAPGVIAGIVAGAIAVLALLSGWAWVAWRRRRALQVLVTPDEIPKELEIYKLPEYPVEMEHIQFPVEMTGNELAFELETPHPKSRE